MPRTGGKRPKCSVISEITFFSPLFEKEIHAKIYKII